MIEKIRSLTDRLTIQLFNPVASEIYNVDSINLIIGNNGSGKTTLIRSIIRDLVSTGSPEEFIVEGATDSLGVVYYTATPFHKPMKNVTGDYVSFIDASAYQSAKHDFLRAAREYIDVSKSLEVMETLQSVQNFDFEHTALELAQALVPVSLTRPSRASKDLTGSVKRLRAMNSKYRALNTHANKLEERRGNDHEFVPGGVHEEIIALNFELERIARLVSDQKKAIIAQFFAICWFKPEASPLEWITATNLLKRKFSSAEKQTLAILLYHGETADIHSDDPINFEWLVARENTAKFVAAVELRGCGTLKSTLTGVELAVDTPRVCEEINPAIVRVASELGLIRIGFDTISSGQAAILHQMVSISHAIRTLSTNGKKDILLFIDEGDLLLHLKWQREYINLVDTRLSRVRENLGLRSVQIVIASHSPILASDILRDSITRLGAGGRLPSFGAPLQQIVNYSFDTPAIGLLSQKVIETLRQKNSYSDVDKRIIGEIDDEFVQSVLHRKAFG